MRSIYTAGDWLNELKSVLASAESKVNGENKPLATALFAIENLLLEAKDEKRSVWWIGNGGSSAICSHLSQDLLNKLGIRSHVFNDTSLLTCMANDFGYEEVYARPLKVFAEKKDILLAISSSGKSVNIISCVEWAIEHKLKTITLSGFDSDNPLRGFNIDVCLYLNSKKYGLIELGHEALLHSVIETMSLKGKNA